MTSVRAASAASGRKRLLFGAFVSMLAVALAASAFAPQGSDASSHREAPFTATEPEIDSTDTYAFVSPDDPSTVTLVGNWLPFEEPAGGPNFYAFAPETRYEIKIDNDGDALPDVIYRWIFEDHFRNPNNTFLYNTGQVTNLDDPDLNFFQTYDLKVIRPGQGRPEVLINDGKVAPSDVGEASMPEYQDLRNEAIEPGRDSVKSFAGQADDSFFLDLRVFDLIYGGDFSEVGDDTLRGFNVQSLVLQVPKIELAADRNPASNPVIGVWAATSRRSAKINDKQTGAVSFEGKFSQLSRLGSPLVNELVVPVGVKDFFNASKPKDDAQFLPAVDEPILAKVIEAIYGIEEPDSDPDEPGIQRDDLIQIFLTGLPGLNQPDDVKPSEQIRLNMNTPLCEEGTCDEYSRLGVIGGDNAGYPNGRRLADDVVDISLQVVEGELIGNENDLGDGVDVNELSFLDIFPYLALPHRGSDPSPHDDNN